MQILDIPNKHLMFKSVHPNNIETTKHNLMHIKCLIQYYMFVCETLINIPWREYLLMWPDLCMEEN